MFAALVLAIAVVGCGGGVTESDVLGVWTGSAGMTYEAMQNDASGTSEQATFLADQEGSGKTLKLELLAEGKGVFTLDNPIECTWALAGDEIQINLPVRQSGEGGAAFSGMYQLKFEGKKKMSGPDPNVEGYTLTFVK